MIHLNSCIILCCYFVLVFIPLLSAEKSNAIILSDVNVPDSEAEELEGEFRGPIFFPTNEWQEVLPGQPIPRGLHVRINLSTGRREAKLLDPNENKENEQPSSLKISQDLDKDSEDYLKLLNAQYKEKLKYIKSEDGKTPEELIKESNSKKNTFRSFEEIKSDLNDLMFNVETDQEVLKRLIIKYKDNVQDSEVCLQLLEDFEYMLHQIDNAVAFIDMDGLSTVLKPSLNSSELDIQIKTLIIIGSSSQSNPKVQIAMIESGIVRNILSIVQNSQSIKLKVKAVYALSCIMRGFPYAQKNVINIGGFEILRKSFIEDIGENSKLQIKILSLFQDLIHEYDHAGDEYLNQLAQVNIYQEIEKGDWCRVFTKHFDILLQYTLKHLPIDVELVDIMLQHMKYLSKPCNAEFKGFLGVLDDLVLKLSKGADENDEYLFDITNDLESIMRFLDKKDEL